ncbi:hypothetical protein NC651_014920 [Populus alba x Populus x berolinensis]|nr:hypothetical protein NC651_014920 [Populus alba x Populus x berolinensis]
MPSRPMLSSLLYANSTFILLCTL